MKKLDYWNELDNIVTSNILSKVEKQHRLDKLKSILIFDGKSKKWVLNQNVLKGIYEILETNNPAVYNQVDDKLSISKDYQKIKKYIPKSQLFALILSVIIGGLHNKPVIPETTFKILILNFLSEYMIHYKSKYETYVLEDANQILLEVIDNKKSIRSIGINGFDKIEKSLYRCITIIFDLLENNDWINVEMSNNTEDNYLPYYNDNFDNYAHKVISLNTDLSKYLNVLEYFPTRIWPLLTPPKINKQIVEEKKDFLKGFCIIESNNLLINTLQYATDLEYKYDYKLCQEAILNVDRKDFIIYRKNNKVELSANVYWAKSELKKHRWMLKTTFITSKTILNCLILYVSENNLDIYLWFVKLYEKIKSREKDKLKTFFTLVKYKSFINEIIINLVSYIIEKIDEEQYDFVEILTNYELKSQKTINLNSDLSLEAIHQIIDILSFSNLKEISNIKFIIKAFNQKNNNFIKYWKNHLNNIENINNKTFKILKKDELLCEQLLIAESNYSNFSNVDFKVTVMEKFRNLPIHFKPHISVNGRLAYEGYCANPHVGSLFRFAKIKGEYLTERGLHHVKLAFSRSLGNIFETEQDHLIWLNQKTISELDCLARTSVDSYVYFKSYLTAKESNYSNTPIRLDQCASALCILGHWADCSYYKKITNVTNNLKPIQTYEIVGKDIIYPNVMQLITKWQNDSEIVNNTQNKLILDCIETIILNKIKEKKFIKYIIMPQAYNITFHGICDKIIETLIEAKPTINWKMLKENPMFQSLSLKIWHAVGKASPKVRCLRRYINQTQKKITKVCRRLSLTKSDLKVNKTLKIKDKYIHKYVFDINWPIKPKTKNNKNTKFVNQKADKKLKIYNNISNIEYILKDGTTEKIIKRLRYLKGLKSEMSIWKNENGVKTLIHDNILLNPLSKTGYLYSDLDLDFYTKYADKTIYMTTIEHKDCITKYDYKTKDEILKKVWNSEKKYSEDLSLNIISNKTDVDQSNRALLPILTQHHDAAVIRELIRLCEENHNFTPTTIHDGASCHPNNVDNLAINFKKSFATVFGNSKMTNKQLLEKVWLTPTLKNLEEFAIKKDLDSIKLFWDNCWLTSTNSDEELIEKIVNLKPILESNSHWDYE